MLSLLLTPFQFCTGGGGGGGPFGLSGTTLPACGRFTGPAPGFRGREPCGSVGARFIAPPCLPLPVGSFIGSTVPTFTAVSLIIWYELPLLVLLTATLAP